MTRLLPFLILAGLATELASIILVGNALGVIPTLLLLFLGGAVGIGLIRSAGSSIAAAFRGPVQASSLQRVVASRAMARLISGIFFIVPGFFSDLLGLLLILPPVRQWLHSKINAKSFSSAAPQARRYDTVIDAEAVEIAGEVLPPDPAHRQDRRQP
jgi:UPF0716 protein FxsA